MEDNKMSIKSITIAVAISAMMLLGTCNKNNQPSGPTQPNDGSRKVYGIFQLQFNQSIAQSSFKGKLVDGPIPVIGWDTIMTIGECSLLKPINPFCEDCGSGYVCVNDSDCQAEPESITAGTVTITGLTNKGGNDTSTLNPLNGFYFASGNNVPTYPPSEGGTMILTASGNDSIKGFTLSAKTISLIETSSDSIEMNPGEPVRLNWKAASNQNDSKIMVVIDVSYHGGSKGRIQCICLDDGELEIPAVLLDSLKTFGISGHPKLEIYRESYSSNENTGAQIQIQTSTLRWLKIPGLISCTPGNSGCPDGYECSDDQRCVKVQ
jgi:hypothetical protein